MKIKALHLKLYRDLLQLRAQTATTAILVICGVSVLISSWSAYRSLRDSRDAYYNDYKFGDIFCELKRAPFDLAKTIENIPGVSEVEARIVLDGLIDIKRTKFSNEKEEPAVGRFISLPNGKQSKLNQIYLRKGRLPSDGNETEVVLHEGFAEANKIEINQTLSILVQGHRQDVKVVGIGLSPEFVYALSPAAPLPDDKHFGIIWMPVRALETIARMKDSFNSISVTIDHQNKIRSNISGIKSQIDELAKPYGSRGSYGRDAQASSRFVNDEIEQQKGTAVIMPIIFLSVAAFLIHIISSRLIAIHRPQIATLKAIGYTNSEVSFHYLAIIMIMMLMGAIPGIAAGSLLGKLEALSYESFFRFPRLDFSLSPAAVFIGLSAGILPGLVGAFASIRSAFSLPPAEAMRPPNPPSFYAGFFDTFKILSRIPVRHRMLIRHLLFRPVRLAFSITGISTALSIVIMSISWNDIIRYLLDTQFQRLQREDLSVTFITPTPQSGLQELSKLTGVLDVEGYRIAPMRIRYLNHKREMAITGWPERSRMRQRLDFDLNPIHLPDDGILLSDFFRKSWGLKSGDLVILENLDGPSKQLEIRIAGFTKDLIGISASMNIHSLWKLLNEQPSYNMATLQIDPNSIDLLYIRLKELPQIATVSFKKALYNGFQETIGTVMRISTYIMILFSLAIAAGVIYNSIRVSFSERSWEIASLRVLGFSRFDTFKMLLMEVGLQTLFSIIPGCLLGLGLLHLIIRSIDTENFGFPVVINYSTYATGITIALTAFLISALSVNKMIIRLNLSDALKSRD